jgi:hypothetical protein
MPTRCRTANLAVGRELYEMCMNGDRAAVLFWMRCRAGWRETDAPSVNVSATASAGIIIKVPMPIAADEWNRVAAEQQAKSMELTRTLSANIEASPVNNAIRPAMPEPAPDRMVLLDEAQPGEVLDFSQRKPRKVRVLTPLERA